MTFSVAVAGASGYAGGEVLRLLAAHPHAQVRKVTAHSTAGSKLGLHQPHLQSFADLTLQETTASELAGHDVIFLGLPHGASGQIAREIEELSPGSLILDLGADHRLKSAAHWSEYYGGEHPGTWTYGMPELLHENEQTPRAQRALLSQTKRIAVPGCNVTAVTLGIQPGINQGLVKATDLVAVLANGYSGAGKSLKPHLLAAEALGAASPYAVGGVHRHIPEIAQNLEVAGAKQQVRLSFTPTLVPMSRGILATVSAPLEDPQMDTAAAREIWAQAYANERFVRLLPPDLWPNTAATLGANTALVNVAVDRKAGRLVVVTAIDNLVKGTAGAGIQSMNLALGFPEDAGLHIDGVAP